MDILLFIHCYYVYTVIIEQAIWSIGSWILNIRLCMNVIKFKYCGHLINTMNMFFFENYLFSMLPLILVYKYKIDQSGVLWRGLSQVVDFNGVMMLMIYVLIDRLCFTTRLLFVTNKHYTDNRSFWGVLILNNLLSRTIYFDVKRTIRWK